MRYTRLYKPLLVALIVLAGLWVAADVISLQVADSKAAAGFAQSSAAERVHVSLGGFPFLPGLLSGRFARVELDARGMSGGGLRVDRLSARGRDLRFSTGGMLRLIGSPHARRTKVSMADPIGSAEIAQPDLQDYLQKREPAVRTVTISPSGIEVAFANPADPTTTAGPLRYYPRIEDGRIVLDLLGTADVPRSVSDRAQALRRAIELPPIPAALRTSVSLGNGSFAIEGSGPTLTLLVGEDGMHPPRGREG